MADGGTWQKRLREMGRVRPFRRGERLLLQGFDGGAVLVVDRGILGIVATTCDGDEVTLALRGPGDVVGSHSAVTGEPVGAGVVALEDGEGTVLAADRYREILLEDPVSMLEEITILISKLRDADNRLVDIATGDLNARVARQLGRLCGNETEPVHLPLTQTDLASMVGAGRASVSAVLVELRARGAISTGRGEIIVIDIAALA